MRQEHKDLGGKRETEEMTEHLVWMENLELMEALASEDHQDQGAFLAHQDRVMK